MSTINWNPDGLWVRTLESHTVGEPTRIVYDGFPEPEGETMAEKKQWLEAHADQLRSAILCEPRGHKDMVGAVLCRPCDPEADLGVVYMDAYRWINMCGHASMGVAYAAVKTGMIQRSDPVTTVRLDTPAGLVSVQVTEEGNCTLYNVPSYLALSDCAVELDGRRIPFRVAFGGTFFALVDLRDLGLGIDRLDIPVLVAYAKRFLAEANRAYTVSHPLQPIERIVNAEFYEPVDPTAGKFRNIVISEQGEIDRSPCGTGTCAELAALVGEGILSAGQPLLNTNFLGVSFLANVAAPAQIGPFPGILPAVTGRAYLTGRSEYWLDPEDPCRNGFLIG